VLLFKASKVGREVKTLISQRFEASKDLEHESVEMPAFLLAAWKRVGQKVEEHGFAATDFAV
jgi:hypothetical protein